MSAAKELLDRGIDLFRAFEGGHVARVGDFDIGRVCHSVRDLAHLGGGGDGVVFADDDQSGNVDRGQAGSHVGAGGHRTGGSCDRAGVGGADDLFCLLDDLGVLLAGLFDEQFVDEAAGEEVGTFLEDTLCGQFAGLLGG